MEAQCVALEYRPGMWRKVRTTTPGPKPGSPPSHDYPSDTKVVDLRDGWTLIWALSELLLTVEINGDEYTLQVGRFFKWQLGRLTKKRQHRLRATMPRSIRVRETTSPHGTICYIPEPNDLQDWYDRAFSNIGAPHY